MKEPFVPKSTISEMLPLSLRRDFFRRVHYTAWRKARAARLEFEGRAISWPAHVPAARTTNPFGWSDKDWKRIVDGK